MFSVQFRTELGSQPFHSPDSFSGVPIILVFYFSSIILEGKVILLFLAFNNYKPEALTKSVMVHSEILSMAPNPPPVYLCAEQLNNLGGLRAFLR